MAGPTGWPAAGHIASQVLGATGLVVLVVGTFLPWLDSGRAHRNSYQAGGALQRLLGLRGAAQAAVSAWPLVGLACATVVAIFVVGLRRSAALLALLTALATGAVAVAALRVDGNRLVRPVQLGPTVTLVGATAVLLAVTLVLISAAPRTSRRSTT
ncbi:MAG: hypothetical protein M3Y44_02805 [Actinomycetota bacterium]|nr:hypothetical protein [Actinomycetota bacterium]